MKIKKFENLDNSAVVTWEYSGEQICISNNCRLIAIQLKSGNVLIIHIDKTYGTDNAFIYEPNGEEIFKIENPLKGEGAICFDDVFYSSNELTLIVGCREKRVACVIEESGLFVRQYITK